MYALRKSYGPLSAGTRIMLVDQEEEYLTFRLAHVSRKLRDQIGNHGTYRYLLGEFPLSADLVTKLRNRSA